VAANQNAVRNSVHYNRGMPKNSELERIPSEENIRKIHSYKDYLKAKKWRKFHSGKYIVFVQSAYVGLYGDVKTMQDDLQKAYPKSTTYRYTVVNVEKPSSGFLIGEVK